MRHILVLVPLALAFACSQRVTPEDEYAEQARERPLMPASAAPVEAPAPPTGTSTEPVSVAVEWAPGPEPDVDAAVLFVIVRPEGQTAGPPLAVRRIPRPEIPLTVEIGPDDAMIAGTLFPDRVVVEARIDQDGIATTRGAGDWSSQAEPAVPGGEARLVLTPDSP